MKKAVKQKNVALVYNKQPTISRKKSQTNKVKKHMFI
jgi:hypothetical protein